MPSSLNQIRLKSLVTSSSVGPILLKNFRNAQKLGLFFLPNTDKIAVSLYVQYCLGEAESTEKDVGFR